MVRRIKRRFRSSSSSKKSVPWSKAKSERVMRDFKRRGYVEVTR